jgi:hypothetical protein
MMDSGFLFYLSQLECVFVPIEKKGLIKPNNYIKVHRKGRNTGLIVAEERAQTVVTHLADEGGDQPQQFGWTTESAAPNSNANDEQPAVPITELLKSASKIVLLKVFFLNSKWQIINCRTWFRQTTWTPILSQNCAMKWPNMGNWSMCKFIKFAFSILTFPNEFLLLI